MDVDSLVMVSTSAWLLGQRVRGHTELLVRLLDPRLPGNGWIRWDSSPTTLQGGPHHTRWYSGSEALEESRTLATKIQELEVRAQRDPDSDQTNIALASLRHQVFLDGRRFRAVSDDISEAITYYMMLDFRIYQLAREFRCHVSRSVWSEPPRSCRFRPEGVPLTAPTIPIANRIHEHCLRLIDVDDSVGRLLMGFLIPRRLHVFGRLYELPRFWVVVPPPSVNPPAVSRLRKEKETDPWDTTSEPFFDSASVLARIFLDVWDIRDTVIDASVINGHFLTFRRFRRPAESPARSTYLILPAAGGEVTAAGLEEHVADIITNLTELEAIGSTELYLVLDDLAIWENHIAIYDAVVKRASILWDALVTHFPVHRLRKLSRAHQAVELIHQILLHGIADLEQTRGVIRECQSKIDATERTVGDLFNETLTERRLSCWNALRPALTQIGLFSRVRKRCQSITDKTTRVSENYNQLIQTITQAFDERRVRESDALQRGSAFLSIIFSFIGLTTIIDAVVRLKPVDDDPHSTLLGTHGGVALAAASVVVALGIILIGVVIVSTLLVLRLGRLGSRPFRRQYQGSRRCGRSGLWQYLRLASFEPLERHRRLCAAASEAGWDSVDRDLAARFAEIWDNARQTSVPDGVTFSPSFACEPGRCVNGQAAHCPRCDTISAGKDITALSRMIEQWAIQALLLAERPRRMYRYALPRLTCLYRSCGETDWTFVSAPEDNDQISLVADSDFTRSMYRIGFTEDETHYLSEWLRSQTPDMRGLLRLLEKKGLRVPMDADARTRFLTEIQYSPVAGPSHEPGCSYMPEPRRPQIR